MDAWEIDSITPDVISTGKSGSRDAGESGSGVGARVARFDDGAVGGSSAG